MRSIWIKRIIVMAPFLFLIYFLAGLILPFCNLKTVGEAYRIKAEERNFYGEERTAGEGAEGESACIIETAQEALDIRLQMISSAKESIVLATFDMRDCESTRDISALLLEAADRGVKVELLVDGVSGLLRMRKPLFQLLGSHENIEIRVYNTPNLLKPWTLNGRMHDKYIMVDGTYLLMGGRNTFDYFLGAYTDKNLSLDREVFFVSDITKENSAIAQMNAYYEKVWNMEECRPLYDKTQYGIRDSVRKLSLELNKRSESMRQSMPENFAGISFLKKTVPVSKATLLYNPVHITGKEPWVFYELSELMKQAEERVYIHTPYAVFDSYMYEELAEIAACVPEVSMQLNAVANGDNICASSDYIHNKAKLLACGMTLYEYDGGNSSHGKSLLIDDRLSVIGSFNFDMRSTYIDTELMFVIDSRELNKELEKNLLMLEEDAVRVISAEEYVEKPGEKMQRLTRGKELFLRVFGWMMQPFRYFL